MRRQFWVLWVYAMSALLPERAPAPSIDGSFTNSGLFSLTNHTSITGNFTNHATGVVLLNGWELNPGGLRGTRNFGTIIVGVGTLFNSSGPLTNQGGTTTIAGGVIKGGLVTNSGYLSGFGTILSSVDNSNLLVIEGGSLTIVASFANSGTVIIGANQLNVLSGWTNRQTLTLTGGTICGSLFTLSGTLTGFGTICAPMTITSTGIVNATGDGFNFTEFVSLRGGTMTGTTVRNLGSFAGRGTINALFVTYATSTVTAAAGSLTITNLLGNTNPGAFQIDEFASLYIPTAWSNSGVSSRLDMNGGSLTGATFTAGGIVQGFGTFNVGVIVGASGSVTAQTNTLTFASPVSLTGGVLDAAGGGVLQNRSRISGFGSITTTAGLGQFENLGTLTLSGAMTIASAPLQYGTFEIGAQRLTVGEDWTNSGLVSVTGGTLATFSQLNNDNLLRASGRIESALGNRGSFQLTGNTTVTGFFANQGSFSTEGSTLRGGAGGANATTTSVAGATMTVGAGTASFDGTFVNYRRGTVTLAGGGLTSASSISNEGFAGGQPVISGFGLLSGATGVLNQLGATLTATGGALRVQSATGSLSNNGFINVASGARLDVSQPWVQFQFGSITPSVNLSGGTLSGATLTLGGGGTTSGGILTGFGTVNAPLAIGGNTVTASGGTLNFASAASATTLGGGTIAGTTVRNLGWLVATGAISAPFENRNAGRMALSGPLTLSNVTAPTNTGTILVGAHPLIVSANWTNAGFVDVDGGMIRTGGGTGLFTNTNFISVGSSIDSNFTNTGSFVLTNSTSITGNFTNTATGWTTLPGFELKTQGSLGTTNDGTMLVGSGTLNNAAGAMHNTSGQISLAGGGILGSTIVNSGQISGHGLIAPALTNQPGGTVTANAGALVFSSAATNKGALRILSPTGQVEFRANFANEGDGASGGVLDGSGTIWFAPTGSGATFSNTVTQASNLGGAYDMRLLGVTVDSGTVNFEVTSTDVGRQLFAVPANGFSIGTLTLPNTLSLLRLLDLSINQGGGTQEAIYVENLRLGDTLTAANFDFGPSSLKIYYNHIIGGAGFESARVIYHSNIQPLQVIPEPNTLSLLAFGAGLVALIVCKQRNTKRKP